MTRAPNEPTSDAAELLHRRILLLEHQRAIADLTSAYNDAWDGGDVEAWLASFAPDGEFIQKGVPRTKGHDALRTMITAMLPACLVHLTMNHRITVEGDRARQRARVVLGRRSPRREPDSSTWVTSGSYDDRLVLTDSGWRFASRTFLPDASLVGLPAWW